MFVRRRRRRHKTKTFLTINVAVRCCVLDRSFTTGLHDLPRGRPQETSIFFCIRSTPPSPFDRFILFCFI